MKGMTMILCVVSLLLPNVVGLSWAAEPESLSPGPGGNPADIDREVLWLDNPDFAALIASSEVIGILDLETEVANDFMIEVDATIRKITWWGTYWDGFEEPTGAGFNLRFYMMDADCLPEDAPFLEHLLPGDDCCETYVGDDFHYVYAYCLELPLAAGVYWFSVQMADHEFPPQWDRLGADMVQICDSVFRSLYFSYPEWVGSEGWFLYDASQMFVDVCDPTPVANVSWGALRELYH